MLDMMDILKAIPGFDTRTVEDLVADKAITYSMLTTVYNILANNVVYNEFCADYAKANLEKKRKKFLTAELSKLGYVVLVINKQPKL